MNDSCYSKSADITMEMHAKGEVMEQFKLLIIASRDKHSCENYIRSLCKCDKGERVEAGLLERVNKIREKGVGGHAVERVIAVNRSNTQMEVVRQVSTEVRKVVIEKP